MKKRIIDAILSALVAFLTAWTATSCVFGNEVQPPYAVTANE